MADDIEIEELHDFALASVMARRGVAPAKIGRALGGKIPAGPQVTTVKTGKLIGAAPAVWFAYADGWMPNWEGDLRQRLDGLASVSDQSSAYSLFRVSGKAAPRLLQRGLSIDLDDSAFGPGSAAVSVIAHIGVLLWRPGIAPSYHVACFRSHETSFRHWLDSNILAGV